MNIIFRDKKLREMANDYRKCQKKMGEKRAKIFHMRLNQLQTAETLEDVRHLPGHFHELSGNRKGQWACDLGQPYRLIFEPHEKPVPVDTNGKYLWNEIKGIEIIEIVNYHGK